MKYHALTLVMGLLASECLAKPISTIASWYGRGTSRDPKPMYYLRLLKKQYPKEDIYNWFCAMPDKRYIGRKVMVYNPKTKKSVVLIVADVGPNQKKYPNRGIDICYNAAKYLGFVREGLCKVYIKFVSSNTPVGPLKK